MLTMLVWHTAATSGGSVGAGAAGAGRSGAPHHPAAACARAPRRLHHTPLARTFHQQYNLRITYKHGSETALKQ
jgi:hypothetical protein